MATDKEIKDMEKNNFRLKLEKADGGTIIHGSKFTDKPKVAVSPEDVIAQVNKEVADFLGGKK